MECEHLKEVGCIKNICTCNTGPKQETLEEAAEYKVTKEALKFAKTICYAFKESKQDDLVKEAVLTGIQWQQERSYSEEDMEKYVELYSQYQYSKLETTTTGWCFNGLSFKEWFEQFKKK